MIQSFLTVGQQVLILFMLVAVGFVLGKAKLMDDRTSRGMTNLVLYAVTPCMSIVSFQRPMDRENLRYFFLVMVLALVIHGLTILLSGLLIRDSDTDRRRQLRFASVFSNCGFMAYPLETALLGSIGVFFGSAYVIVFTLLGWTYGLFLLTGDKKSLSLRPVLLNPGVVGVVGALLLYLFQVTLPPLLATPVQYMANLNTPLPMIIVGYQLSNANLRRALSSPGAWVSMALRLVVVPLAALALCLVLQLPTTVTMVIVISAGAPAAALLSMFSARLGRDTELSASLVSVHTLCSAITMPLIVGLAQYLA